MSARLGSGYVDVADTGGVLALEITHRAEDDGLPLLVVYENQVVPGHTLPRHHQVGRVCRDPRSRCD